MPARRLDCLQRARVRPGEVETDDTPFWRSSDCRSHSPVASLRSWPPALMTLPGQPGLELWNNACVVRLVALLLTVTLTGPSVTSLLCDWTCAARHQAVAANAGGCHKHDSAAPTPTVAAGHRCHELAAPDASILTNAPPAVPLMLVAAATLISDAVALSDARLPMPATDSSHAPPPLPSPLRI